jgi:hypothetical protein
MLSAVRAGQVSIRQKTKVAERMRAKETMRTTQGQGERRRAAAIAGTACGALRGGTRLCPPRAATDREAQAISGAANNLNAK